MEGLSAECKKASEKHKEEMNPPPYSGKPLCPTTPCVGRAELVPKGKPAIHAESEMCLPKECQNSADIKAITTNMNKAFKAASDKVDKIDSLTIEIDCSANGGADKGSGGDKEITVDDDFVRDSDKQESVRMPDHPAAPRAAK